MKKIVFSFACIMTMLLTSCFEETGYNQTQSFWRYVTIDTTGTTLRLKADCTGEVFDRISNLSMPEQLGNFGLSGAQRALVQLHVEINSSFAQRLTLLQGQKIKIYPVTNQEITDSLMHFAGLQSYIYNNNYAWVTDGFLNVMPITPSSNNVKYYLTAESAIGDTLVFNLNTTYSGNNTLYYDQLQCFDLRTLNDTINADDDMRVKMQKVLKAIEDHRSDSVRILLKGNYAQKSIYTGKDTIVYDNMAMTNYFYCNFIK